MGCPALWSHITLGICRGFWVRPHLSWWMETSRLPSPAWVGSSQPIGGLNRTKGLLPPENSAHHLSEASSLPTADPGLLSFRANSYCPPALSVYMLLLSDLSLGTHKEHKPHGRKSNGSCTDCTPGQVSADMCVCVCGARKEFAEPGGRESTLTFIGYSRDTSSAHSSVVGDL